MKRTIFAVFSPELLLRHGQLSVFSIKSTLDVAIWRKRSASYTLGAPSISTNHYTDMSKLLDSVIQHGIDGAHRQWCRLPYTMDDNHQVLSRLAL